MKSLNAFYRTIVYIDVVLLCYLLTGCGASYRALPPSVIINDSLHIEHLKPYPIRPDSASMNALFRCDEQGRVLMELLEATNGKNISLSMKLDSLGNLSVVGRQAPDTLFLPSEKTYAKRVEKVPYPVEVPVDIKWYETALIYIGGFCLLALGGWAIISLLRRRK